MRVLTVPQSNGESPFLEFNSCHGQADGRFCAVPGEHGVGGGAAFSQAQLDAVSQGIKKAIGPGLAELDLRPKHGRDVQLETIAVARGAGGRGVGSAAMRAVAAWADGAGTRLVLSPSERGYQPVEGGPKTSSTARLVAFYRRFGFVPNRGRYADPALSSTMYRVPKAAR